MSQRRTQGSPNETADFDLDPSVKECVRYIICREGSKSTLKRADILDHLKTVTRTPPKLISAVLTEANKNLKRVYGYRLVQLEARSGVQYILVLNDACVNVQSSAADPDQRKLLTAALAHILMSGGTAKEEEMWLFLEEAGLMQEEDYAGRKLLISTFTKQMYLTYSKVPGGEGELARHEFSWGQRATEEIPKMFLLQKVAGALGKTPDYWCEQHRMAQADDNLTPTVQ